LIQHKCDLCLWTTVDKTFQNDLSNCDTCRLTNKQNFSSFANFGLIFIYQLWRLYCRLPFSGLDDIHGSGVHNYWMCYYWQLSSQGYDFSLGMLWLFPWSGCSPLSFQDCDFSHGTTCCWPSSLKGCDFPLGMSCSWPLSLQGCDFPLGMNGCWPPSLQGYDFPPWALYSNQMWKYMYTLSKKHGLNWQRKHHFCIYTFSMNLPN
jgi:hypothetical protein